MKTSKVVLFVMAMTMLATLVGCAGPAPAPAPTAVPAAPTKAPEPTAVPPAAAKTYKDMVVGFIQTGSEGGWRAANTASFKETA
jgi:hypothetical protein